ncbi:MULTISPECIES: hypothetical protein [unclassified Roseateles]|uniref:hypothetical protein n=1 Tax=unclassified Roseateles TaxID=2626991 RepID=UPI000712BF3F|nr:MULTISPECIES: hypothetical protein [unclassified Roseateles]KQW42424.1 hypothetical protein ASC81_21465 [Pelomonas sp. Root405]KRA68298.1 hypothetical protein ASD88_23050 [Pelomonas sp. Root662]
MTMDDNAAHLRTHAPPRRCLLTWWSAAPGEFSARVVLEDGRLLDFDSPFELARFLGIPMSNAPATSTGLR